VPLWVWQVAFLSFFGCITLPATTYLLPPSALTLGVFWSWPRARQLVVALCYTKGTVPITISRAAFILLISFVLPPRPSICPILGWRIRSLCWLHGGFFLLSCSLKTRHHRFFHHYLTFSPFLITSPRKTLAFLGRRMSPSSR